MRRCPVCLLILCLFVASSTIVLADPGAGSSGFRFQPKAGRARTIAGDDCTTAVPLAPNQSLEFDLCQAWNDYDPGRFGCSPCPLPGPEVVATMDTQSGEMIRVSASIIAGSADVRIYLATDCEDPEGSCIACMNGPATELQHTVTIGGEVFLYLDTTGECATVKISREMPASALATSFSALKAVYR